jgi:hypothetical protein
MKWQAAAAAAVLGLVALTCAHAWAQPVPLGEPKKPAAAFSRPGPLSVNRPRDRRRRRNVLHPVGFEPVGSKQPT